MIKIVSRKSLGTQTVYDIGVEHDHNFLLSNGLIASNCFNKSHSTAYAYVTYQTAYLKANFPVEYMAALLTANSGDQDKVKKYITNCQNMNIEVEGPNVNRSGVEFTPAEGKILFGLSAVKNLGEGAIASILQSRDKDGPFKSLADLCDRVNLHAVNGRALEALIHCGAFDTLESNRNQLIQDLPLVIDWAKSRAKDRQVGQGNLFDLLGGGSAFGQDSGKEGFKSAPKAPAVPDFPPQERLQKEKELLGFYISAHPLKAVVKVAQVLALTPINLGQLGEMKAKANVSTVVMLTEVKPVTTKKGDRMAILQIEDLTGQAEAVVFPKNYENIAPLLVNNATLILWGKVDKRDDQTQLIVEDAEPVEAVQTVMVELKPQQVNAQELGRLRTILQEQRGKAEKARVPVIAVIAGQHRRELRRLDPKDWVQDPVVAVNTLKSLGFEACMRSLTSA